jgi:hypothetical protein
MKHFVQPLWVTIRLLLWVALFQFSFALPARAQGQDSKGTDFWLTFPGNLSGATASFFITGDENTSGMVTIPGIGFSESFTVTAGAITTVVLPSDVFLNVSNVPEAKGIHVTSGKEVTIYALNRLQATTDAYLALPTDILGTEYLNLGYVNSLTTGTQFGIVATQNATMVTIIPKVTTDGHVAGTPYTITLNQGQTYLLRNTSGGGDLSGSSIASNKPIAVFGSHQCTNVPPNVTFCDYIIEQLPPTTAWGRNFVTVPLKTRTKGDTFRFMASENNTAVSVNGSVVANLDKGEFHERILTAASQVTATKPILVAQYSNGTSFDNVTSDPFMMLIPPYEQFLGNYTIATPASGFRANFVNIVAPNAATSSLKLDGTAIPASAFTPIGSSGFSGAQVDLSPGTHTINGTTLPFGVFVYGFDAFDSYGYPGGQSLSAVATVTNLTLTIQSGGGGVGGEKCFNALVRDQNNQPVAGVRVDFEVEGVNPGAGFATTNNSGIAQFCYTGVNPGQDKITASVGEISDEALFTWANEVCGDGIDNDGDGQVDEGCDTEENTFYRDSDEDGYGDPNNTTIGTTPPTGYVAQSGDCDDTDDTINPGATELCDGKDNNCNNQTDEGLPSFTYFKDGDGDGFGGEETITSCSSTPPEGYVSQGGDCNDEDPAVHPGGGDGSTFPEGWLLHPAVTTGVYNAPGTEGCSDGLGIITPPVDGAGGPTYIATSAGASYSTVTTALWLQLDIFAFAASEDISCALPQSAFKCSTKVKVYIVPGSYTSNARPSASDIYGQTDWVWLQPNTNRIAVPVTQALVEGEEYRLYIEATSGPCNGMAAQRYVMDQATIAAEVFNETFTATDVPAGWQLHPGIQVGDYNTAATPACGDDRGLVTPEIGGATPTYVTSTPPVAFSATASALQLKFDLYALNLSDEVTCAEVQTALRCSTKVRVYLVPGTYTAMTTPTEADIYGQSSLADLHLQANHIAIPITRALTPGAEYRLYIEGWNGACNRLLARQRYVIDNLGIAEVQSTASGEVCGNGIDDNCNGEVDENCGPTLTQNRIQFKNGGTQLKGSLSVKALPNPSRTYFTLQLTSSLDQPASIRVVDGFGRITEVKGGITANGTYSFGHHYRPGVYVAEVLQGGQKATVKLVKQP